MFQVSTYHAECGNGRAEVWAQKEGHCIKYYDSNGVQFHTETFAEKTLSQVENIAEDWVLGQHVLFG